MKNKLYLSLFAVVVSSATVVTVMGGEGPTHLGMVNKPMHPGFENYNPTGLGESDNSPKLGTSSSAYAPSELEDTLRYSAKRIVDQGKDFMGVVNRVSSGLEELANKLSFFRQNEPEMFVRYFGSEMEKKMTKNQLASFFAEENPEDEDDSDNSGV